MSDLAVRKIRGASEFDVLEFNRLATRVNLFTVGWRPYRQIIRRF